METSKLAASTRQECRHDCGHSIELIGGVWTHVDDATTAEFVACYPADAPVPAHLRTVAEPV